MKKLTFVLILFSFLINCYSQEWNWKVGNGGNNGRNSLADCVIGPGSDANVLWDYCSVSSLWPHQIHTCGDVLVTDRTFDVYNTLHGTYITAYNLTDGKELWTKDLPVDFEDTDWRNRVCGISETMVFATRSGNTNTSYLYALDIDNGEIIWQSEALVDMSSTEGVIYADDGDLLVGNFNNVMRINVTDGTTVWVTLRNSPTTGGSELARYNNHIYGWSADYYGPKISVFDVNTGALLYESRDIGGGFVQQIAPLASPQGIVYAPRAQGSPASDTMVAFLDTGTGLIELWQLEMGWVPNATHGIGPDSSFYMYSREFQILRIKENKEIVCSKDIKCVANHHYTDVILNDLKGSIYKDKPGYVKINFFKTEKKNPIPVDTSIYIGDPNAAFNDPKMAIDAEGNIYLSNGYNDIFCFDYELNLIWTETISKVGGPALAKEGTLAFPAAGNVIKVYQGGGNICPTTYPVTFYVHNQSGNPLEYAIVTVGTQSLNTNEEGKAVFNLEEGDISYRVEYMDYTVSDTYTITTESNQLVDVEFTLTAVADNYLIKPVVYPNPANKNITIVVDKTFSLNIIDLNGKILLNRQLQKHQNTIDVSGLREGVYLLSLKNQNDVYQMRLIKL